MEYVINTSNSVINWNAKGIERKLQNISNLINTWRYEVAYDRTKGLDPEILDKSALDAIPMYTAEIYRIIETYEPDVQLVSVNATNVDGYGNINFEVVVEIWLLILLKLMLRKFTMI